MDIEKLKFLPPDEIKTLLEGDALTVEEGEYTKPLSDVELAYYKDMLAEKSIQQAFLLDEYTQMKAEFKEKLTPIIKEIRTSLEAVKFKAIKCTGRLYKLADYETQMIHKVDEIGNLITTRRMLPEERQFRIQALKQQKTA